MTMLNSTNAKLARESTLAALNVIANAIKTAAEALNAKATAINTGAIAGTVALDAGTLAALEAINANIQGTVPVSIGAPVAVTGSFWQATQPVSFTWAGLTDAQLRAAAVPVSIAAPVFMRVGFAEVGSGLQGLAATKLAIKQTGAGMSVNQSGGNLVITTGTTASSETLIRSNDTFSGSLLARVKVILSQRIVNQTFRFELADLIGEALAYTINSATSVTVTIPGNPFTAANVGQALRMSVITGAAGIPGRYAIASVAGDNVTFTVAAWPASGSGTLTLYGHNWIANEYSGTTATNSSFDAQRRGWASGNTTATINTTASPGHVAQLAFDVHTAGLGDALVASNAGYQWTNRASRVENLPDPDVPLYLFIVVQNGSTAPASTTTLTVGFLQVEDQGRQKVRIASSDPTGAHAQPVQVMGGALGTQPVSGTVTATVTGATQLPVTPTTSTVNSAASTNATSVKASAGTVWSIVASNINAAARFLKIYNKASAPTVGTDVPVLTIAIPPGGVVQIDGGSNGIRLATGIAFAITTAAADSDTGAVAANEVKVVTSYT